MDIIAENRIELSVFGLTHEAALEVTRRLGVKDRSKSLFDPESPWHILQGKTPEGIIVKCFCAGLPPHCRIEKVKERVPKTQTVELGEFIEIERTKIVCADHSAEGAKE